MRWETLNAYVDGELDAEDRHRVAEALAQDPVLAARVATLSRLKHGVRAAVVPRRRAGIAQTPLGWACAMLVLALIGIGLIAPIRRQPADPARAAFAAWNAAGSVAAAEPISDGVGSAPLDLAAAGFQLIYLSQGNEAVGRLFGYEGRHGCRLAVWSGPSTAQGGLEIAQEGPLRLARWDSGGRHYVLLSETLPAERFATLAEAAELLARPAEPGRLRLALDRALGHSERPCAG
ncbi:anti-sigma factor family protein [Methylorubrum extorquens]|uniref:Putative transmembrane anti-sigma factor n=1 Tax=Methylorubrum extorquens (strain CM4 / NCIMB 13688) TaxID=440085 RepID=B7L2T9_METC4|nr:anti-sigma factor [Methylorubrum extorquens]ACK86147.1 putative transmembrane anti-sigma factor [Methylorubrum extorquens CM4]